MKKVFYRKMEIIEGFAKRVPNAERIIVSFSQNYFDVYFSGIQSKRYSISEVLEKFVSRAQEQGVTVVLE